MAVSRVLKQVSLESHDTLVRHDRIVLFYTDTQLDDCKKRRSPSNEKRSKMSKA